MFALGRKMNDTKTTVDAKDALDNIRKAEEEAAAIVWDAREKAGPLLVATARDAARKVREELLERTRKDAEALKRSAVAEAVKQAEAIRTETEREKARMREQAASRMAAAVEEAERCLAAVLEGGSV
jgi:vacuolar-type H+-ATPase subunit H